MNDFLQILGQKNIEFIDNFISKKECDEILLELEFTHWSKSNVVKYNGDEYSPAYFSDIRKSETSGQVWFTECLNNYLSNIEKRLSEMLHTNINHFEEWQATKYDLNDKFDYHVDCGNWKNSKAGERKRTILLYLETPIKGGETQFRALNLTINAIAGRLLIWNNLLPGGNCNYGMIHSGLPVLEGTKTILVTWERERLLRGT